MFHSIRLVAAAVLLIFAESGIAQSASVSLREPAVYSVSDLYRRSDKVALVKVLSGDTEAYEMPIYKGRVVTGFKGALTNDVIYFGPYLGMQLGSEYVLFLQDASNRLTAKNADVGYGVVTYSKVFNEGYSSMLTSYECAFKGSSPKQSCAYAVRICTDYIKLPQSLQTAPPQGTDTPFGCRWAKREQFISILDEMAHPIH